MTSSTMRIIKNRRIIDDQWRLEDGAAGCDDGADLSAAAHVILPLQRWLAACANSALDGRAVGVRLAPDEPIESIAAGLDDLRVIALEFGSFHEGRGYSQAVRLRRQYHFTGEIRALDAHRDNLPLMERCGIDAYQLADGENLEQALAAFEEITAYNALNHASKARPAG